MPKGTLRTDTIALLRFGQREAYPWGTTNADPVHAAMTGADRFPT